MGRTFLLLICLAALMLCTDCNNRRKPDYWIEEISVSKYKKWSETFSFEAEAKLNADVVEYFYAFCRDDLKFRLFTISCPSTVIYQVFDGNGKIIGSGSSDGEVTKREITIPYKDLPERDFSLRLVVTLTVNGMKVDRKAMILQISKESLSSPFDDPEWN